MSLLKPLPLPATFARTLHVALVVGTRPEAIKLAPVALALQARPDIQVSIWCTGQHPVWATEMLGYFRLPPSRVLDLSPRPAGLAQLCSAMLRHLQALIDEERPDVVVVQGDTSSAFAGALAAAYGGIPLVHVEAGLRSGRRQMPFPEEAHRRAIANFAALHCAPTDLAVETLLAEGIPAADVLHSGNTVIDAMRLIRRRAPGDRPRRSGNRPLLLLTCHRRESWGAPYAAVCAAARRLVRRGDCEIVFVAHPNPDLAQPAENMLGGQPGIRLVPPLGYPEFIDLLGRAALVLTDSGGVQEEAAAIGTPVLVLRDTTERPEGLATGTACLVGTGEDAIVAAVTRLLDDPAALAAMRVPCTRYGDGHAATLIASAVVARWARGAADRAQISVAAATAGLSVPA